MNTEFNLLKTITAKPEIWSRYTARELWAEEHISNEMLSFHLDPESEPASRPHSFIDRSAEWIADHFELNIPKRVIDFGCGPGLYTTRFHDAGALVTGVDFSPRSLAYARSRAKESGRNIRYIEGNYLDITLPDPGSQDLATMIYCDLCPLSPAQRKLLLGRIWKVLAPEGSFFFDVFSLKAYESRSESSCIAPNLMGGFWSAREYTGVQQTWKYEEEKVILDKYDIFEKERIRTIYNWLQYFSPDSLGGELQDGGFRIKEIYSNVSGAPYSENSETMAVEAVKIV
ncbi:MAG: class I SAM-dependent methyltransferase [Spirochaetales bacterium]|nr:class I SAM-dependent methyltransferase [Spirochaetales bacterium]